MIMTKDIAPELIEKITADFEKEMQRNHKIKELLTKLADESATYRHAQEYAKKTSEIMSDALLSNLSSDVLPDGKMYYNIAQRVIQETLGENGTYGYISGYCDEVQRILSKEAKIGIKAVTPELNQERIDGIVDIVSGKDYFDAIKYMLEKPIVNFGQSIVDEAVRVNADFQYNAGLSPKVIRTSTGHCCKWCSDLAGTYDYEKVKAAGSDVWKRHEGCKCLVEYVLESKQRQTAGAKRWKNEAEHDKIKARKLAGLTPDDDSIIRNIKENIIPAQNRGKISNRQDIHKEGTALYEERKKILSEKGQYGPSYVTVEDKNILELVSEYSGTGDVKYNRKGEWNFQETITTNDKIIGIVIDNRNGNSAQTSVFKIHYGKNGIHIVPDYPSKKR